MHVSQKWSIESGNKLKSMLALTLVYNRKRVLVINHSMLFKYSIRQYPNSCRFAPNPLTQIQVTRKGSVN